MPKTTIQPLVAFRALRRLIADPQQTHEVFTVLRALSGNALQKGYKRFRKTPVGARVLRENIQLLDTLQNRELLATYGHDTLADHYLTFAQRANITADGLVEASTDEFAGLDMDPELYAFANRQRDMHDLWHTVTEYGTDELGEVCLLAFTYAQTRNRGIAVICLAGCFKLRAYYGNEVFRAAFRAYRAGKKAAWLPGEDWEALLQLPINQVRQHLRIPAPTAYQHILEHAVPA